MRIQPGVGISPAGMHVPAALARVSDGLDQQPRSVVWALCVMLLLLVFAIDFATAAPLLFDFLYLLPVGMAAWHLGGRPGLTTGVLAGGLALFAARHALPFRDPAIVHYWNAFARTAVFFTAAYVLTLLKQALHAERALARTDALTGLLNKRHFAELAEREVQRARRVLRPLTVAYMDVDNFKAVNDSRGHDAGDALLREIGRHLRAETRAIDLVCRIGGDEFVVLLSDAPAGCARAAIDRVLERLERAAEQGGWGVGFSIGVVTADNPGVTVPELIRQADRAMYGVKRTGGGGAAYREYASGSEHGTPAVAGRVAAAAAAVDHHQPHGGMQ